MTQIVTQGKKQALYEKLYKSLQWQGMWPCIQKTINMKYSNMNDVIRNAFLSHGQCARQL